MSDHPRLDDAQRDQILMELKDKSDIIECTYRYSRGIDRHDEELARSAYHADAVDCHGSHFIGPAHDFVPWVNQLHSDAYSGHLHFVGNHTIKVDGDSAHCESYVIYGLRRREGGGVNIGGGRYLDRLERRDGVWRILVRHLVIEWLTKADPTPMNRIVNLSLYSQGRQDTSDLSYQMPLQPAQGPDQRQRSQHRDAAAPSG